MKKLSLFQQFNFNAWQTGKRFMIQGVRYNDKKGCVSLDVIIVEDATDYGDKSVSNIFEKFKVHLINDTKETDANKYHISNQIVFKSISHAQVWGEYNSNLSVYAIDIEVVK